MNLGSNGWRNEPFFSILLSDYQVWYRAASSLAASPVEMGQQAEDAMGYTNQDLQDHPQWRAMIGEIPPDSFSSNGATCAPDVLWGVSVRPAAHLHDYGYSESLGRVEIFPGGGGHLVRDERHRFIIDQQFLANLITCGICQPIARAYYFRVRLWGHFHYHYTPGYKPKRNLRFWMHLFFGRFIEW